MPTQVNCTIARHNADLRDSQRNFFIHMTEILMSALDLHVDTQTGHARRVAHIANRIGRKLGFEGRDLERWVHQRLSKEINCRALAPPLPREWAGLVVSTIVGFAADVGGIYYTTRRDFTKRSTDSALETF